MKPIKTVSILGANGNIGSQCAGIIAGFGNAKIYMIARDLEKSQEGIRKAIDSIKSDTIKNQLIPKTYDDLQECLPKSDWIFELVSEDFNIKQNLNNQISKYKSPQTIVSTVSSGLSITKLAQSFSNQEQKYYFGTHFYNPPYKMILCELINNPKSDPKIKKQLSEFLKNTLHRKVVETNDTPGFAGNRIGFQILNEAAIFAYKYKNRGGIAFIDELLGGFTGRTMPPMETIDLVGLDIHKAIVDNIYQNTNDQAHNSFKIPKYIQNLINQNHLGDKTKMGLYKTENNQKTVLNISQNTYEPIPKYNFNFTNLAKEKIKNAQYQEAIRLIIESTESESDITKYFFARYISYSLSLIGKVVKKKEDIDMVMGYGFNWLPPCALIDLLGGKNEAIKLIKHYKLLIPQVIQDQPRGKNFYTLQNELDYRSFLRAN